MHYVNITKFNFGEDFVFNFHGATYVGVYSGSEQTCNDYQF